MSDPAALKAVLLADERIHLDASVLALHLTGHARYTPLTRMLFGLMEDGEVAARTSSLSIYQLLIEVYRQGDADTAKAAERYLTTLPGLELVDVTTSIAHQAAEVRAQLGGSVERAVQISTALAGRAGIYLTQHSAFRRVAGMRVESLDQYSRPA